MPLFCILKNIVYIYRSACVQYNKTYIIITMILDWESRFTTFGDGY